MPLYFFHVDDGDRVDRLGVELPDLQRARKEAAVLAGELLRDRPDAFWQAQAWTTTVTDAAGLTLFTIQVEATSAEARLASEVIIGSRPATQPLSYVSDSPAWRR
jgi:hypothetical protein